MRLSLWFFSQIICEIHTKGLCKKNVKNQFSNIKKDFYLVFWREILS